MQTNLRNDSIQRGEKKSAENPFDRLRRVAAEDSWRIDPTKDLPLVNQGCLRRDFLLSQMNKFYFEEMVVGCLVKIHYGG